MKSIWKGDLENLWGWDGRNWRRFMSFSWIGRLIREIPGRPIWISMRIRPCARLSSLFFWTGRRWSRWRSGGDFNAACVICSRMFCVLLKVQKKKRIPQALFRNPAGTKDGNTVKGTQEGWRLDIQWRSHLSGKLSFLGINKIQTVHDLGLKSRSFPTTEYWKQNSRSGTIQHLKVSYGPKFTSDCEQKAKYLEDTVKLSFFWGGGLACKHRAKPNRPDSRSGRAQNKCGKSCKRRKSKIHFYEISGNTLPKNKAKQNKNVKK